MAPKEAQSMRTETNATIAPQVADAMKHLEKFAAIGPRPTCSEAEKKGAFFARDTMEAMGVAVTEDRFRCNPRMFRPHMTVFLGVVAMGLLPVLFSFHAVGFFLAAFGCLFARKLYTDFLHNKPNVVGAILPKSPCRNMIGKIAPRGEMKNRIVFLSHLDSAICSPIFGEKMVRSLKLNIKIDRVLFAAMALLYVAAGVTGNVYPYYAAVGLSLYVVGSLVVLLYSELFSPTSPGANDNGTGVASVLALAETFSKNPLQNTEVWCVCLGAEEPAAQGSLALFQNHEEELKRSYIINVDSIGVGSPAYLVNEGYIEEYKCDPEMIAILKQFNAENPNAALRPYEFKGWGGYTDCTHLLRNGCKAITVVSNEADGLIKNWHTMNDVIGGIQKDTFANALRAVHYLAIKLDQKFSA